MSKTRRSISVEQLLYGLVFLLALGIRFFRLGALSLSDFEAAAALPAWEAAGGAPTSALGAQPGYAILTWVLFFVFNGTNFLARFWPALAGSFLAILPFFMRRRLGRQTSLVLALGLAFDPSLVAASRLAGGPVLAIACGFFAMVLFTSKNPTPFRWSLSGVLLGLALLSGPSFWLGALAFGLAYLSLRVLGLQNPAMDRLGETSVRRIFLLSIGLTLLLAGTFFLRFPQGIGALGEGLTSFIEAWSRPAGVPSGRLLAALLAYQGLVLVFGLVAAGRAWRQDDSVGKAASLFALAGLLVAMLYPGRQVFDLAWMLIPLWVLAAREIGRMDAGTGLNRTISAGLAIVLLTLGASAWVNLARLSSQAAGLTYTNLFVWTVDQYIVNLIVILGAALLMGLSFTTIRMWDPQAAGRGLVWGLGVMLLFSMVAGVWSVSQRDSTAQRELWLPEPYAGQTELLRKSLHELGDWTVGQPAGLDISTDHDSPSLRWALRDFPNAQFGTAAAGDALPAVVLAAEDNRDLQLASSYRGQDFVWSVLPVWDLLGLDGWLRWWVFRSAPAHQEQIILWARTDLFLAGDEPADGELLEPNPEIPSIPEDPSQENLP